MAKKVLMLHGYSQNAHIFSKRMAAIRKGCGKDVELVFVDGPIILQPADLFGAADLSALGAGEATAASDDPNTTPRGWWRADAAKKSSEGIEKSLASLKEALKGQIFDGVFGFSQGAAMAAVLAALLEAPYKYPDFLVEGQPLHPPLKFCVSVSGFLPSGPISGDVFTPSYKTPTVHVVGKTDVIVSEERSQLLIDRSTNARVEGHIGGHFVPSKANWRKFFVDYMMDSTAEIPSPGDVPLAPVSGTATPKSGVITLASDV